MSFTKNSQVGNKKICQAIDILMNSVFRHKLVWIPKYMCKYVVRKIMSELNNFIPELLYFSIVYIIQKLGTLSLKHLQVSIHFCHGLSGYLCLYVNLQRFGGHAVFVSSL